MCCSDPCRWIHQGTGLRPPDALTVGGLNGLTPILKLTGPLLQVGSLHRPISARGSGEFIHSG